MNASVHRFRWALILSGLAWGQPAPGQCLLDNPSFELTGSGGSVFGGWNQFGAVGSSSGAVHGALSARVSGPGGAGWTLSAVWQPLDTSPGETWSASVWGWHASGRPLTGQCRAILNIEWRGAGGALIDYESHTVADASTPVDTPQLVSVTSQPAPPGAVTAHFLLGALQAPGAPSPDVFFDQATFEESGPPGLDELQWGDFPGGRTLQFSGRTWRIKGPGTYSPGPNWFSDAATSTWVDADDRLHLTIRNVGGTWSSTEVVLEDALGYGDYVFTTRGRLDAFPAHVVLGMFLWEYRRCYDPDDGWWNPYNEIDFEFSRWGDPGNDVGQFVVQPYDFPGNIDRFAVTFSDNERTSHAMRWLPDRVEYRSWRGGPLDESTGTLIHAWTYTGPHVPRPERPRVHLNLWYFDSPPGSPQEAVIDEFTFRPACTDTPCDSVPTSTIVPIPETAFAFPNPFRASTDVRFRVEEPGAVVMSIHDVAGRRVRWVSLGHRDPGEHGWRWSGTDDEGNPLASGIYFYRVETGQRVGGGRLVLVR